MEPSGPGVGGTVGCRRPSPEVSRNVRLCHPELGARGPHPGPAVCSGLEQPGGGHSPCWPTTQPASGLHRGPPRRPPQPLSPAARVVASSGLERGVPGGQAERVAGVWRVGMPVRAGGGCGRLPQRLLGPVSLLGVILSQRLQVIKGTPPRGQSWTPASPGCLCPAWLAGPWALGTRAMSVPAGSRGQGRAGKVGDRAHGRPQAGPQLCVCLPSPQTPIQARMKFLFSVSLRKWAIRVQSPRASSEGALAPATRVGPAARPWVLRGRR